VADLGAGVGTWGDSDLPLGRVRKNAGAKHGGGSGLTCACANRPQPAAERLKIHLFVKCQVLET